MPVIMLILIPVHSPVHGYNTVYTSMGQARAVVLNAGSHIVSVVARCSTAGCNANSTCVCVCVCVCVWDIYIYIYYVFRLLAANRSWNGWLLHAHTSLIFYFYFYNIHIFQFYRNLSCAQSTILIEWRNLCDMMPSHLLFAGSYLSVTLYTLENTVCLSVCLSVCTCLSVCRCSLIVIIPSTRIRSLWGGFIIRTIIIIMISICSN